MKKKLLILLLGLSCWASLPVYASHIVGGNFEMIPVNNRFGTFSLYLAMFFDELSGQQNSVTNTITVSIFRRRDNFRMQNVIMNLQGRTNVTYANQACATARSLRTSEIRYYADITLNPVNYDDIQGYYVVWERCCRNAAIDNIVGSGQSGMVFYLDFPPLRMDGQDFKNASPLISFPNGEYICRGEPFRLAFDATDADGDRLQYQLLTPLAGFASSNMPTPTPSGSSNYPEVRWVNGYDELNQISGNPPLRITGGGGVLTVTADRLGLHVFSVVVTEYRGSRRLGSVRRDFQLLVVDCPRDTPPKPTVFTDTQPNGFTQITFCEQTDLLLKVDANTDFTYQWQKDGDNIAAAIGPNLIVRDPGKYTVIKTYTRLCGKSIASDTILVRQFPKQPAEITGGPTSFCEGGRVQLQATTGGNLQYIWLKNTDTLRGVTAPSYVANSSGSYVVAIKNNTTGCTTRSAAIVVTANPLPKLKIATTPTTRCDNDSTPLSVTNNNTYTYQWQRNGTAITGANASRFGPRTSGSYAVFVRDTNRCSAMSDTVRLTVNPSPVVVFDSLMPFCGNAANRVALRATPAGGVFAGKGVTPDKFFDPRVSGLGTFPLTYTSTNQFQCTTVARRIALVTQGPRVLLGPDIGIISGDSIQLKVASSPDGLRYDWSPAIGLSAANILSPVAFPTQTTRYKLRASLSNGCASEGDILITVWEKLTVPNGFTPNGDGQNDTWELPGITEYPDAEVRIFNRWGNEIFYSKGYSSPFDGKYNGEQLPVATYYFVIQPNNGRPNLSGSVTIVI